MQAKGHTMQREEPMHMGAHEPDPGDPSDSDQPGGQALEVLLHTGLGDAIWRLLDDDDNPDDPQTAPRSKSKSIQKKHGHEDVNAAAAYRSTCKALLQLCDGLITHLQCMHLGWAVDDVLPAGAGPQQKDKLPIRLPLFTEDPDSWCEAQRNMFDHAARLLQRLTSLRSASMRTYDGGHSMLLKLVLGGHLSRIKILRLTSINLRYDGAA